MSRSKVSYTPAVTKHKIETSVTRGTIDPVDPMVVEGESQTITYSTAEGYHLSSVMVDSVTDATASNPESFTFSNVTAPHTISVVYDPNTYFVSYNANDGDGSMADSSFTYDVEETLSTNTFTRDGYEFAGWAESEGGPVYIW